MEQIATADDQKCKQHKRLDYIPLLWKSQKNPFLISHCMTVHLQYNDAEKKRPLHPCRLMACNQAVLSEWWWLGGLRGTHQEGITSDRGEKLKKQEKRENCDFELNHSLSFTMQICCTYNFNKKNCTCQTPKNIIQQSSYFPKVMAQVLSLLRVICFWCKNKNYSMNSKLDLVCDAFFRKKIMYQKFGENQLIQFHQM